MEKFVFTTHCITIFLHYHLQGVMGVRKVVCGTGPQLGKLLRGVVVNSSSFYKFILIPPRKIRRC